MVSPADRLADWIGQLGTRWNKQVHDWAISFIGGGIELILDYVGQRMSKELDPYFAEVLKSIPANDPLRNVILSAQKGGGEWQALLMNSVQHAAIGATTNSFLEVATRGISRQANFISQNQLPDIPTAINMYRKGLYDREGLRMIVRYNGFSDSWVDTFLILSQQSENPATLVTLYQRGIIDDTTLIDKLKKQGHTDDQIAHIKQIAFAVPSASDVISFAVKEAYDPTTVQKYGMDQDFPNDALIDAKSAGLGDDLFRKYWRSHWQLPSAGQAFDMLHRGILTYDDTLGLLKNLDYMPFWRDKLAKLSYNNITRIDARRMWDIGVMSDERLLTAYINEGYTLDDAKMLVLWTKVYQTAPDLIARYKNGYINQEEIKATLKGYGMNDTQIQMYIETKIKPEKASRTIKERDLTKAEIIKGVKESLITRNDAITLMQEMGYDQDEAVLILAISIPESDTNSKTTQKNITRADIIKAVKVGAILDAEAINKLVKLGYTAEDSKFILDISKASVSKPETPKAKSLTKADISSAVKKGIISPEDAYIMLIDLGYNEQDATYILQLTGVVPFGSPSSFMEFKQLTNAVRNTLGLPTKDIPIDLSNAERELKAAKAALDYAKQNKLDDTEILRLTRETTEKAAYYNELLIKYR